MGYQDENVQDIIFSAKYTTESKEYFEYLITQDEREVPEKKASAKKRFLIEIIILAVIFAVVMAIPEYRQPLFFLVLGITAVGLFLIYLMNSVFYKGNEKYIVKLQEEGKKKNKNVILHNRIEVYKDEIYFELGSMRYYVRPVDIDEWYESENLLIVKIRQLKTTMCKDIEKILIPKKLLGDQIKEVEDIFSRMIIIGDQVLVNLSNKK